LKVQLLFLGSTSSFVRRPATALLLKKRRRAEYRLPPHSKFFRQTCEAPGGASVCLPGGGHAAVSERRTPNAEVKTLNAQAMQLAGTFAFQKNLRQCVICG